MMLVETINSVIPTPAAIPKDQPEYKNKNEIAKHKGTAQIRMVKAAINGNMLISKRGNLYLLILGDYVKKCKC